MIGNVLIDVCALEGFKLRIFSDTEEALRWLSK